jgi:membrane protease YdiL (CAAX protease family)
VTSDDDRPDGAAPTPPVPPTQPVPSAARPGASIFTIEGRAAPGLFVVGWLASLLGLALVFVGVLAPSGLFLYFVGPTLLTIGLVAGAGSQTIERRARGEAYAGPSPYLVFGAAIAAIYAIGSVFGLGLHLVLGSATLPGYVVRLVGVALQALVFIGIVRLTVVDGQSLSWRDMGWRRLDAMAIRELTSGAFLALPVIGLTSIVAAIVVQVFDVVPEAPLPATGVAVGLVVQLIAGAIIAPVAEETVFRGFAISAWQRTVGARGAIIRASLLFALAHVLNVTADNTGEAFGLIVVGFTTRLPVAFALGWLFVARRSIWAPLGLHMAFNGILLIIGELAVSAAG